MAQPPRYERQTDFTMEDADRTDHAALNAELDGVAQTTDKIRENLAKIQRDDGGLANGIVTSDSMAPGLVDQIIDQASAKVDDKVQEAQSYAAEATNAANVAQSAESGALGYMNQASDYADAASASAQASDTARVASQTARDQAQSIRDSINFEQASFVSYLPAGTGAVATDAQSKLRESVSVKDFGAIGDGVTDDTAAVQAAIDYAQSTATGCGIFFPAGKYLCNVIDNGTKGIHMFGEGSTATVIVSNQTNEFAIKLDRNFRRTLIKDMTILGLDENSHGIYINTGSNVELNNVVFTKLGIGICLNATINVSFNTCEFSRNYVGIYLTCRRASGSLVVPNVNGQTVTLTDAFFPSHPTCTYFNECLITLNTLGFVIDQSDNPYQADCLTSHKNCIVEANNIGLVYRDSSAFSSGHIPSNENVWFEGNNSETDVLFNGVTYPPTHCGDVFQRGGATIWKNCSFSKWYSENSAQTVWYTCSTNSELSTVITADTSSISCDLLYADNSNFTAANLQTDAIVTTSFRSSIAKTQPLTSFCRHPGTQRSNKFYAASPNDSYGSTATNVVDGVFETNECKEYTATVGNGVYIASGNKDPGKFFLAVFSIKRVSGDTIYRVFNVDANAAFTPTKKIVITDTFQTFAMVVRPETTGTGSSAVVVGPDISPSVFRVSGAFTVKFDTAAEMVEFQRRGNFPVL